MKLPDITPAQILAIIGSIGTEAVAAGLLSASREQFIVQLAGIVLPGVLMIGDAVLRHGRSKISVALIQADADKAMQLAQHKHEAKMAGAPAVVPATP